MAGVGDISGMPSFTGGAADSRTTSSNGFDSSNWTVSTGSGSASPGQNWMMYAGLVVAGLIAWKIYKGK